MLKIVMIDMCCEVLLPQRSTSHDLPFATQIKIIHAESICHHLLSGAVRSTGSFASTFDSHQHSALDLRPGTDAPPLPLEYIERAEMGTSENDELLPRFLDLLLGLGATEKILQGQRAILYEGTLFVDTHAHFFLNKLAPDISVVLDGSCVSPFTTLAVLELQVKSGLRVGLCVRSVWGVHCL